MSGTCTIIIPIFNEEKNAANMAKAIRDMYPDFCVSFMDDNSTDRSKELVEALHDPKINFCVRNPEERGLAASCFQGILESKTDYFMTIDCDFQHPIETLGRMYTEMEKGYDLCIGVRDNRHIMGFARTAGSWTFNIMADIYLMSLGKQGSPDVMSGLYAGRCDVFQPVIKKHFDELEMKGWKVLMDLLKYGPRNLKITSIHYMFEEREHGESHLNLNVVTTSFHQMGRLGKFMAKFWIAFKKC